MKYNKFDNFTHDKEVGTYIPQIMAGYTWKRVNGQEIYTIAQGFNSKVWRVDYFAGRGFYVRWSTIKK